MGDDFDVRDDLDVCWHVRDDLDVSWLFCDDLRHAAGGQQIEVRGRAADRCACGLERLPDIVCATALPQPQ